MIRSFTVAATLLCLQSVVARLPEDPVEYDKWESSMLSQLDELREAPKEEAIPKLGKWVMQLAMDTNQEKDDRPVFRGSRELLLSIPGHAEYFATKIRNDDILRETGRGHEVTGGVVWDFETLGQLPSPETVKVLGSFLEDDRHRPKPDPNADFTPVASNDLLAVRAFAELGIASPPLHKKGTQLGYDDIQPWRLWFAQVEAGTRTFRFEGSPQEYSLAGPVAEARTPQTSPPERSRPAPDSTGTSAAEKMFPVRPLVAAGLLLASALWLATRRKTSVE